IATAEVDTPGGTGGGGGGGGGVVLPEDRFELNDTSDKATKLGTLSAAQQFAGLTIATHKTALPDYDWYTWTMSQDGVFHAKITYTPLSGGDLHMRVFRLDGVNHLNQIASSRLIGSTTQEIAARVHAGDQILVYIYGFKHEQGTYTLNVSDTLA